MNKKMTKVFAVTTGAAMFSGMLLAGVGAPAKEACANNTSTAAGIVNLMSVAWDNATNIQVFKTDYGYGAWATDSNGNIIGEEPIAKTPYYIPTIGTALRDTDYGDFVAAYEVNIVNTAAAFGIPGGNTIQTYYDVADFAANVTDHYDHFANALPIWENAYTASASLDTKGGIYTPYILGFEFGDYNENYVEFAGTTWSPTNKNIVDNTQIGVWTNTKLPDFSVYGDTVIRDSEGNVQFYVPEVYMNPVFEDANSLAHSWALFGTDTEDILTQTFSAGEPWEVTYPGQIMPDVNGEFRDEEGWTLGDWGSFSDIPFVFQNAE